MKEWIKVLETLKEKGCPSDHPAALLLMFLTDQVDYVLLKIFKKFDVTKITAERLIKCLSVETMLWIKFSGFYLPNYEKPLFDYAGLILGTLNKHHLQYFEKASQTQLYFYTLLLYEYELGLGRLDAESTSFQLEDLFLYKSTCEKIIPLKLDLLINIKQKWETYHNLN